MPNQTGFAYDDNGNMTNNGAGQTYLWDAADRLVKITYTGGTATEFTYDGLGCRTKIVEKNASGSVTSDQRFVWCGLEICEERDASNAVTKRFYVHGQMNGSTKYFYTTDHLGSIREVTDSNGAVQARYDYDPYGRATKVSGSADSAFLYTGHYYHAASGLFLAPYRAYDSNLGLWLSRDPLGESGPDGPNLYGYVQGDPINAVDPLGLSIWTKLYRVYKATRDSNKLVGQVSKQTNRRAANEVSRLLKEIDTSQGAKRVVEASNDEARDILARRLSTEGKLRGPEMSPGYPEHVHPSAGPFSDVHIQTRKVVGGAAVVTLASLFTPYTEAATRGSCPDGTVLTGAIAWDLASTVDPFFITDAIAWILNLPDAEAFSKP